MSKMAEILNINKAELVFEENEVPDLIKIEEALKADPSITHVGVIHSETTTGILNPIEKICELVFNAFDSKINHIKKLINS